jgi:hypothetical protein
MGLTLLPCQFYCLQNHFSKRWENGKFENISFLIFINHVHMPPKQKLQSNTADTSDSYSTLTKKSPPKKNDAEKGLTIPEFLDGKYYIMHFKDGKNKVLFKKEQYMCLTEKLHNDIVSITDCDSLEEANETVTTAVCLPKKKWLKLKKK